MADWEGIRFILELAFRETGRAILWLVLGGGLGLLISIVALVISWKVVKKFQLYKDNKIGLWGRRLLLVAWIVMVPFILVSNGALWGLIVAAEKTVYSQELIEKAFEESLTPLLSTLGEEKKGEKALFELVDGQFVGTDVIEAIDQLEKTWIDVIWERIVEAFQLKDSKLGQNTPHWVKKLLIDKITSLGDSNVDTNEVLEQARETVEVARAMDKKEDDLVFDRELAWAAGRVYGGHWTKRYAQSVRASLLIAAVIQGILTLLGVFVVMRGLYWLVEHLLGKRREQGE